MRIAARIDENQRIIIEALRAAGRSVLPLHTQGKGCPDLLVGYDGQNYLFECKVEKGELNENQIKFFTSWNGHCDVVRSVEEALAKSASKEKARRL